jgi:hypothetical protein
LSLCLIGAGEIITAPGLDLRESITFCCGKMRDETAEELSQAS